MEEDVEHATPTGHNRNANGKGDSHHLERVFRIGTSLRGKIPLVRVARPPRLTKASRLLI